MKSLNGPVLASIIRAHLDHSCICGRVEGVPHADACTLLRVEAFAALDNLLAEFDRLQTIAATAEQMQQRAEEDLESIRKILAVTRHLKHELALKTHGTPSQETVAEEPPPHTREDL
jgi:hypothetical protein